MVGSKRGGGLRVLGRLRSVDIPDGFYPQISQITQIRPLALRVSRGRSSRSPLYLNLRLSVGDLRYKLWCAAPSAAPHEPIQRSTSSNQSTPYVLSVGFDFCFTPEYTPRNGAASAFGMQCDPDSPERIGVTSHRTERIWLLRGRRPSACTGDRHLSQNHYLSTR
jgi:hypothetical protein